MEIAGENREVLITRKRIKNMILRVERDGNLKVSCPYRVSQKEILAFIKQKEDWILKTSMKQEKRANHCMYGEDGKSATWLGETYTVTIVSASRNKLVVDEEAKTMTYYLKEVDNLKMKKLFYTTASKRMLPILKELRRQWDQKISLEHHFPIPTITVKYMTSRWGSCIPTKNRISMSSRLIHFPITTINYVLLHEYVHFLVQNHSKEFYATVQYYMPHYKEYSDRLK